MKVPVKVPPETEHVGDETTLPVIVHDVSRGEKPEPDTLTVAPAELEFGLNEMEGPLIVVVVV